MESTTSELMEEEFLDQPAHHVLRTLFIPIAMGFMMLMLIDFADVWIASMISDETLAIVGYCYPLLYVMLAVGFGLNQGLSVLGSQALSSSGMKAVYDLFIHSIYIALFTAVVIVLAVMALLSLGWVDQDFLVYFETIKSFIYVIFIVIPPLFILLVLCALCQIQGHMNIVRNTLGVMLLVTFVSHPLISLPMGLGLGIYGIALSKILVTLVGCVYMAVNVIDPRYLNISLLKINRTLLKSLLCQSLPAGLIQLLVPMYLVILTHFLAQYGIYTVAGFSLAYRIIQVIVIPTLGVFVALLVLITRYYERQQYHKLKSIILLAARWGGGSVFLAVWLCVLSSGYFLGFFATHDQILKIAQEYLWLALVITVLEFIIGISIICFQGVQRPSMALFLALTRTVLLPIPALYFLEPYYRSVSDIWLTLILVFSLSALICTTLTYHQFWKKLTSET